MKKLLLVLYSFLLISGCATEEAYKRKLNTWINKESVQLVRSWGPPQQTYQEGNSKFLLYYTSSSFDIPAREPSYSTTMIGNTAYTSPVGGAPAQSLHYSCTTIFEVQDDIIINWQYKGNNCTDY